MAQYEITYRCGHTDTVQIYGTNIHGERERTAAAYGYRDCPACQAAKAAQANEDAGLAALEGSGKQVAWAEEIRSKYMPKYAQERQEWADHGATDEQLAKVDQVLAWLKGQTSAAWWIDNRSSSSMVLRAATKAVDRKEA